MKVGILTTSISRQSGGLLWAVRSLALSLSDVCCRVKIFSGMDDDTEADLRHWRTLDFMTMARRGPSSFGYMPALNAALCDAELELLHSYKGLPVRQYCRC